MRANRLNSETILAAEDHGRPAFLPAWGPASGPAQPPLFTVITEAKRTDAGVELRWRPTTSETGPFGEVTSYEVYRFDGTTIPEGCDLADAAPLVATMRGTTYTDPTVGRASGTRTW